MKGLPKEKAYVFFVRLESASHTQFSVGPMVKWVININIKTSSFVTFQTITINLGGQIYTMTTLATDLFIVNLRKQGYLRYLKSL